MVPGRPSPSDFNRSTSAKAKTNNSISNSSTNSFEKYQNSVSDAWTLSEDELTKEYCILSDDAKPPRRVNRTHKNPIAVVHRHQNTSASSSSAPLGVITNSATTSTVNNILETTVEEEESEGVKEMPVVRKVSNEYG